jgi:hypothetical protein
VDVDDDMVHHYSCRVIITVTRDPSQMMQDIINLNRFGENDKGRLVTENRLFSLPSSTKYRKSHEAGQSRKNQMLFTW